MSIYLKFKSEDSDDFKPLDKKIHECVKQYVISNNIDQAIQLIKLGANVNYPDIMGRTPLHYAKDRDACEKLLNMGALLNSMDNYGNTVLHTAVLYNNWQALDFYVNCKFYIPLPNNNDWSLLELACIEGHHQCVAILNKHYSIDKISYVFDTICRYGYYKVFNIIFSDYPLTYQQLNMLLVKTCDRYLDLEEYNYDINISQRIRILYISIIISLIENGADYTILNDNMYQKIKDIIIVSDKNAVEFIDSVGEYLLPDIANIVFDFSFSLRG